MSTIYVKVNILIPEIYTQNWENYSSIMVKNSNNWSVFKTYYIIGVLLYEFTPKFAFCAFYAAEIYINHLIIAH